MFSIDSRLSIIYVQTVLGCPTPDARRTAAGGGVKGGQRSKSKSKRYDKLHHERSILLPRRILFQRRCGMLHARGRAFLLLVVVVPLGFGGGGGGRILPSGWGGGGGWRTRHLPPPATTSTTAIVPAATAFHHRWDFKHGIFSIDGAESFKQS
jgi:hypothetical protein